MDDITRSRLDDLLQPRTGPVVSLFMPAHRAGRDTRPFAKEDVINWKNLLRDAGAKLGAAGVADRDAAAVLEPCRRLLEDEAFWRYQGDGLAAYAAAGAFLTFRLPLRFETAVVVDRRFHLARLVPLLSGGGVYHVLALSRKSVRLIAATRDAVSEVDLPGVPRSLDEVPGPVDDEQQLQLHTAAPSRPGARRAAMFHGHGVGVDDEKTRLLRFCQHVDRGLSRFGRPGVPLVLAAVDYVAAIYRQASTDPGLVDEVVTGNFDEASAADLGSRAWPIVEPVLQRARQTALGRYRARLASDRAANDLGAVLAAAYDGRVDALFVRAGAEVWGRFDPATRTLHVGAPSGRADEELVNAAVVETLRRQGEVYAVAPGEADLPQDVVAALLRY